MVTQFQRGLDDYPPHLVDVATRRLAFIAPLLALAVPQRTRAHIMDYVTTREEYSPIGQMHIATVYRWIRRYEASGGDLRALIPRITNRGGKNVTRLCPDLEHLIATVLQRYYLVREYRSIDDVWHEVAATIAATNVERPLDQQLACPSRRTIARRIASIPRAERRRAKEGATIARKVARQVNQTPYPERPLARVEIDHLLLDLITVDDQDTFPLGRLTLTYCLDTATCYPLGYFLSFEPPSYWSVMECLYHAIRPKPVGATNHPWLAAGVPDTLVVDQGKEFVGTDLRDACRLLGITLTVAPARTPEFKGRIERQFRRINDQLVHTLPGTTFASAKARGDYASLQQACLTLSDVDTLVTRYLVDIYAQSFHRGLQGIPAQRWQIGTADTEGLQSTPDADLLAYTLGRTTYRCVHPYGIELFGLRYNAPHLGPLRDSVGTAAIKLKYHPGNLGSIAVYHPGEQRYLTVPALAASYANGLALWKHQVIKQLARAEAHSVDIVALGRAKQQVQEIVAQARSRTRSTRKRVGRSQTPPTPAQAAYLTTPVESAWESLLDLDAAAWRTEHHVLRTEDS